MNEVNLYFITMPVCIFSMLTEGLLTFYIMKIIETYQPDRIYLFYLIVYSIIRVVNNFYRDNVTISNIMCIVIFIAAFIKLIITNYYVKKRL